MNSLEKVGLPLNAEEGNGDGRVVQENNHHWNSNRNVDGNESDTIGGGHHSNHSKGSNEASY